MPERRLWYLAVNPVEIVDQRESDLIIVAFGGVGNNLDMPPFEFFNVLLEVHATKVFVRDLDQCYYQAGLRGITSNVDTTATYLSDIIANKYSVFVGHSMGGFGALLFGSLCKADKIVAFAPQVFVDKKTSDEYDVSKWREYREKAEAVGDSRYLNLLPIIPAMAEIYFGKDDPSDRKYINALRDYDIPHIILNYSPHHITRLLRDDKKLLEKIVPEGY